MSEKSSKNRNEVAVGFFVLIGLTLFTVVIFLISGVYLFRPGYSLSVTYDYVDILDKGAPVRMAGVRIGEVSRVKLEYDEGAQKTRVLVKIFIEKEVDIRANYVFKIQGTHILSEPHIEITPEPGDFPILKPGTLIRGHDPVPVEGLIQQAHEIAGNINAVLKSFRATVEDTESGTSLADILKNLAQLTESLNKVLSGSEDDMKKTISHIENSAESLDKILDRIDKGEGTAGKLLASDELYQELRDFVREIKTHPWRLMKKDTGSKFLGIF